MKFQLKGFTSLVLLFAFIIMLLSGLILYFTPRGGTTCWIDWISFGLRKPGWEAIHINICLLFLIATVLHLHLNWNTFWCYLKKACGFGLNMKAEMLNAAALAAIVVTRTVYQLPPFSTIKGFDDHRGPPPGRGPGFGQGLRQGQGEGFGSGQGQGRQGRGQGRGTENPSE